MIYTAHQSPLFALFLFVVYFCFASLLLSKPKAPSIQVELPSAVPITRQEWETIFEEPTESEPVSSVEEVAITVEEDVAPAPQALEDIWEEPAVKVEVETEDNQPVDEKDIWAIKPTWKQIKKFCQEEQFPGRGAKATVKNLQTYVQFVARQSITPEQLNKLRSLA